MDEKKQAAIDKILKLAKQDKEFDETLRNTLKFSDVNTPVIDDNRLDQIYEYCIEKIVRRQAQEFYKDFPLKDIKDSLEEDFVRMESFRRKDYFGDFCLALYQQIECMTNQICNSKKLDLITEKMWGCSAYVKNDTELNLGNRADGNYLISMLIFPGQNKKTGIPHSIEKSKISVQSHYAMDKIRIVVYFLGYKAMMRNTDYDNYKEITSLLYDIYQCRNTNHRGNALTPRELEALNKILPLKSFYYFKFLGVLAQFVEYVKNGFPFLEEMASYAQNITAHKAKLQGPKVLGKIEL